LPRRGATILRATLSGSSAPEPVMLFVVWIDECSIGTPMIDAEPRYLFNIIKLLHDQATAVARPIATDSAILYKAFA
jgi:hypothetical protein